MTASRPGILLDRDGTIIVDHGYVGSVDRVEFIDGAPEAIASFNAAGIPVAVVTNQAGVARGLYGLDDVAPGAPVHRGAPGRSHGARVDLFVLLPVPPGRDRRGVRPHQRGPQAGPGMAKAAAAALNLDLTASWVVGDRPEDIGLAEAVGASAVYLGTGDVPGPGVWPFPSLAAAAPFILERDPRMSVELELRSAAAGAGAGVRPGEVPGRAVRERGLLLRREYAKELARAGETIDPAAMDSAAEPSSSTPTRRAPGCSPAATAARPRSPTTCSATT